MYRENEKEPDPPLATALTNGYCRLLPIRKTKLDISDDELRSNTRRDSITAWRPDGIYGVSFEYGGQPAMLHGW